MSRSMALFQAAARHVAKDAGNQTLHTVTDLNSAEQFAALCLVKQRRSFWFWKKPTMIPTQLKLQDILTKKLVLPTGVLSNVLMEQFKENPKFSISGEIGGKLAKELQLDLATVDSFDLSVDLGDIVKSRVGWEELQQALKDNPVDFDHELLREIKSAKRTSLCVVLEALSTKSDGKLDQSAAIRASASAEVDVLPLVKTLVTVNATVKGAIQKVTTHSFTIPPGTVLAYSCNEADVSAEGILSLHATYDKLDDNIALLDVGKTANADKVKKVQSVLSPLIKSDKLTSFQLAFKNMMKDFDTDSWQAFHLLLASAEFDTMEGKMENIKASSVSHLLGNATDWLDILKHLDFTVPSDLQAVTATIGFPASNESGLVGACLGVVDALLEMPQDIRGLTADMPKEHLAAIMKIVELEVKGEEVQVSSQNLTELFAKDPGARLFLQQVGFAELTVDDIDVLAFKWNDAQLLVDLYTVLYALSQ